MDKNDWGEKRKGGKHKNEFVHGRVKGVNTTMSG